MANTKRMNRLEELGRVDSEKAYTKKGKKNLKAEKKRIVKEVSKKYRGGSMGGGMNPMGYSPDPTVKSITGYNPLKAAQGSDVSVESVQAQMNNNPVGIAQYFPRKFGMINGPGGPKEDKIPAMLSDGEFVFTAKAVDNAGGPKAMYNMMNKLDPESSKGRGIMS